MTRETKLKDREALARRLAFEVAKDLRQAIDERGAASLVLSGGSTPAPFFEALSEEELPWEKVWITLADERWVEPDDEASNEGMVKRLLLQDKASSARFVGLKNEASSAAEGVPACEQALSQIPRPFDVVILGMGGDGHTASLFPAAAELEAGLDLETEATCLAVTPPAAPHARMSLTLRALLESRRRVLHITGDEKWQVYKEALAESEPREELPIRAVLHAPGAPVDVFWAP